MVSRKVLSLDITSSLTDQAAAEESWVAPKSEMMSHVSIHTQETGFLVPQQQTATHFLIKNKLREKNAMLTCHSVHWEQGNYLQDIKIIAGIKDAYKPNPCYWKNE